MSGAYAVQKAVHAVLSADAELAAMVQGIYDHVPRKTAYPYVVLGESRMQDVSSMSGFVGRVTLTVYVYSRAKGKEEAHAVLAHIRELLHDTEPELEGSFACIDMRTGEERVAVQADGQTVVARLEVMAMIAEAVV
jgi:hypothetical protein